MGRVFLVELEGSFYSCKYCKTHLAYSNDVISETDDCRNEKGYLFENLVNIRIGDDEVRTMATGTFVVADVCCVGCLSLLGWIYYIAYEESHDQKILKYSIERFRLAGPEGSPDDPRPPVHGN